HRSLSRLSDGADPPVEGKTHGCRATAAAALADAGLEEGRKCQREIAGWALPHHARDEPRLAPRRLDVLFQIAMRVTADIAGPGIGPGAAFVVGGARRLAGLVALGAFQIEIAIVAAETVDRGFDRTAALLDHAGAAHAGDAAIILRARRHVALEPAHRASGRVGRITKTPGAATAVALAYQRAIRRIAGWHRRARIIAARPVEIGLRLRLARGCDVRANKEHQQTRLEQAGSPHT